MTTYHAPEEEEHYTPNDKLDSETNRELVAVYRRMNIFVRLYNAAWVRIADLEKENSKLKQQLSNQGKDIELIKNTLGNIEDNTKWTRRTITQALLVAGLGAVSAFVTFLVQRGF